ncbi:hypothetical protein L2D01_08580 [Hyphomonadaceae bacterium ML37]|nr:hypothetical protein L2D01_08580 [Hyphomonadaceae bacterium ML37]
MILTRLSHAIRTQNWFAVVLEFVIVIAGVVIGFQVTAWSARQADLQRGQLYLDRLAADLEENLIRTRNDIQFRTDVRNLGLDAAAFAAGEQIPDSAWHVVVSYFNASQSGSSYPVHATFDELIFNGDLGLIRDITLRSQLTSYYTTGNIAQITDAQPAFREQVRMIIPTWMQDHIWVHCYRSGDQDGGQTVVECSAPPTRQEDIAEIADALLANDSLTGHLRFWLSTQYAALTIHVDNERRVLALLEDVLAARESAP